MNWLANNWRSVLWFLLCACIIFFGSVAGHYHSKYTEAASLAEKRQETINDMQRRQKSVAALDQKYTKELADAKATIDQLHDDVAAGKRRLQLNATCTKQPTASSGLDDAASAELTPDARQNYFRLREQLATSEKQIRGLQDYIRKVVFDEKGESNQ
ncbi:hypothetical protein HA41_00580 [Pantoea conspicua]|uniref:Lysis protein n=1 Tax=Pantoea conspicua TaxID=472705 RepID=A0A1X1C2Q3_9GAMM|nr:lysis protein [Pantoea conspicua]ORM55962.1 hypothetical protein HA41_00580 [Pantoea conspicua]